jgi:anti-sigma B factor antagonist
MQPPLTSESDAGGTLVRVVCRLDAEGTEPLVQEIDRLLRAGEHVVRLDLAAVAFISSAGIGGLVSAHKKLVAAGGRLAVVAASPQVAGVLRLTKLDTLIGAGAPSAAPVAAAATVDREIGDVRLGHLTVPASRPHAVRIVAAATPAVRLDVGPTSFALGLGTPDVEGPQPLDHAGEFVAAAGCLFHRPPAADPRIDWDVAQAGHAPRLAVVEGLAWEGAPTGSAGFESSRSAKSTASSGRSSCGRSRRRRRPIICGPARPPSLPAGSRSRASRCTPDGRRSSWASPRRPRRPPARSPPP